MKTLKLLLFFACILFAINASGQTSTRDTIKIPILTKPFVENGEYVSTTSGILPNGTAIVIKTHIVIDVPRDTVFIRHGYKKI